MQLDFNLQSGAPKKKDAPPPKPAEPVVLAVSALTKKIRALLEDGIGELRFEILDMERNAQEVCHATRVVGRVERAAALATAVDAIGAWPPIVESHVEGDGALALYEAWVKIQTGECDVALVFSNGKTTSGPIDRILNLQADPYMVTPLWPGFDALAALQARAVAVIRDVITPEYGKWHDLFVADYLPKCRKSDSASTLSLLTSTSIFTTSAARYSRNS